MKLYIDLRGGLKITCGGINLFDGTKFSCTDVYEVCSSGAALGFEIPTRTNIDVAQITKICFDDEIKPIYRAKENLWNCHVNDVEIVTANIYNKIYVKF